QALCNMRAAIVFVVLLPASRFLRLRLRRATRSAALQTIKARGSSFGLASRLSHETRGPFSQVQRVGHKSGEGSIDVKIVPMKSISTGGDPNLAELFRVRCFEP